MQALLHRIVSRIRDESSDAASKDRAVDAEEPSYSMFGGTAGFVFYWLAFAIPFMMVDAGLVVLTAFISPHRAERDMVRDLLDKDQFIEIFVDTPLAICEARDPKGLYKKARAGELKNFTGIDSVYQAPEAPDVHLDGEQLVTHLVPQLLDVLRRHAIIKP